MADPRYSFIPARAVFDKRLSATDLRVLSAYGTYIDKNGWCFPSDKEMISRLDVARSTLGLAKAKLVQCGYLQIRARTSKRLGKIGNEYRVLMDQPDEKPMSDGMDIGSAGREEKPNKKPMSDRSDIGSDVRLAGHPMSDQPDIPYNDLTNPYERTHISMGETPPADAKAKRTSEYDPAFLEIWKSWPREKREASDKKIAYKRWKEGIKRFGAANVAAAATRYLSLKSTQKENFQYCCSVERFMNGKLEAAVEAATNALGEKPIRVWDSSINDWVERR